MTPGNAGGLVGKKVGDYELRALLGAGGMAEVYRGYDTALGREVAVKILPASLALDAGYVERFRDEAHRVANLTHPNVVPVYTYGEADGLLYLVMPILKESLRDRMEREGTLPPSDAAKLTVQVAAALDAAHAQGIVHRDVKPENILLNNEGKAHLTDFGIARELSFLKETGSNRTLAATGLPVGTPEYMAPEQLRAGDVDQRADIYALGAVLYELLTGAVPHEAPTPYEVAALVLTAPTMPPSQRNPQIWPELEAVMLTALAKDAKDRYRDARSFAMALRRSVLQRDPNAPKLTMPASLNYTGAPVMPGTGPLVLQGPSGPLVLNPQMSPMSGPLGPVDGMGGIGGIGGMTGAFGPLPGPVSGPGGPVTTSAPAVWSADPRTKRLRPRPVGRRAAVIAAVVVLVFIGVCGGSSLAVLSGILGPSAPTDLRFPIGNGLTGATGTQTVGDNGNGNNGGTGTGIGTTTTGQATVPPDATAGAGLTPIPTVEPTAPPQPTATATPVPDSLSFSPTTLTVSKDNNCTGQQTVTNNGLRQVSWQWTGGDPGGFGGLWYTVARSDGTSINLTQWPPKDTSMPASSTDTLTVFVPNCKSHSPVTVKVNATFTDGTALTYSIAMQIQ